MRRILLLHLLLLVGASLFAADAQAALRRFAMFIGSNDGGRNRVKLRYAESDARAMAGVMQELGGVAGRDSLVLLAPTSYDLDLAFQMVAARVRQAHDQTGRVELVVYYSGHSDEQGLLLAEESFSYAALKDAIQSVEADVNIAILDSCFSGAFTRLKGGTRLPPFMLDESVDMRGHAFLSSSSADEAAQESDNIEGSFFTHYLISGLRGAADSTRDGQVSLNEVYHYAFSETLARTEGSEAGPQHPSYNIQLTGTGDLTLTDLRVASSGLELAAELSGRLFIRDGLGRLVLETGKEAGAPVALALPAGRYVVSLDQEGRSYQASVTLGEGQHSLLGASSFSPVRRERTVRRGPNQAVEDAYSLRAVPPPAEGEEEPLSYVPFSVSIVPSLSSSGEARAVHMLSLNLIAGSCYAIQGCELGAVLNLTETRVAGVQMAGVGNVLGGDLLGYQAGGVFNVVGGNSLAFQQAGVFNLVEGDSAFLQAAGVFNMSQGRTAGVQAAGVFNLTERQLFGAQLAGVVNWAARVAGAQVGLVNISGDVTGAQIGLVNVAAGDVRGSQIGLVNISRDLYGVPVGLVNVVQKGTRHLSAWWVEKDFAYVGYEMGSRYFYTLVYAGGQLGQDSGLYVFGSGFGLNIPLGSFFVNTDLSAKLALPGFSQEQLAAGLDFSEVSPVFPSLRILGGVKLLGFLNLFGGVVMDSWIPGYTARTALHEGASLTVDLWGTPVQLYPRLFTGIKL
jgi:hypothetical protein